MTKRLILVAVVPLLALVACSTTSSGTSAAPEAGPQPNADTQADLASGERLTDASTPEQQQQQQRDVIRTASLTVLVADPEADSRRIQQQAEAAGGYVENVSTGPPCRGSSCPEGSTRSSSGSMVTEPASGVLTITVRVPAARYQQVLDSVQEMGEVAALSVNANDVTAQTQDLDARIESQRASVARVRQLMQRANTVNELVQIERELSSRQADLESMLAQRKGLADAVALSTITATLVAPDAASEIIEPEEHWWDQPWNAFVQSWRGLITVIAALTPLIVLGLIALAILLWVLQRRRRRRGEAPGPVEPNAATPAPAPAPAGTQAPQPAEPTQDFTPPTA